MAFTTTAKAKTYLGITGTDDDTLIGYLIAWAQKAIQQYCHNGIESAEHTEYYDGPRNNEIVLRHRPIISITSIYDDLDREYTADDLLESGDYYYYTDEGIIVGDDHTFLIGRKNIKITYTAGYAEIPPDVELACILQVSYWYNRAKSGADGVTSEKLGDYSISYVAKEAASGQLSEEVKTLVQPYKNYQV